MIANLTGPHRLRPLRALQAMYRLNKNPDGTEEVFHLYESLEGDAPTRYVKRMRASASGRAILDGRPRLLDALTDRDALAAMPHGSLGRRYLDFVTTGNITAEGLVEASESTGRAWASDADETYLMDRIRDMHDLWHVVTGYDRDLVGEASLVAFTAMQLPNLGGFALTLTGLMITGRNADARRTIRRAMRRGKRAKWLVAAQWETLLSQPISRVRDQLNIDPPRPYVHVPSPFAM